MTTPIRSGTKPRSGSRADTASQGLMWQRLAGKLGLRRTPTERDQDAVDRALKLAAFLRGEPIPGLWPDVLEPMFQQMWDETLAAEDDAAGAGDTEQLYRRQGGRAALQKWAQAIDSTINLGAGALERLAARHVTQVVAAEASKESKSA